MTEPIKIVDVPAPPAPKATNAVIPKILVVGDSGTHKTFLLKTIPGVFVFDFDRGLTVAPELVVESASFKDAPRGSKYVSVDEGIYPYGTAWPKFIAKLNGIGTEIDKGDWNDRPIAIDSLTTMANCAMAYVLQTSNHDSNPQIQHWGAQIQLLETVIEQLASWPVPLIMTAHIQRNTNDLTQVIEYLPLVTGKFAAKVALYYDEIYFTQVKGAGADKKFTLKTESDQMYRQAKTRHAVPDGIETNWAKIIAALNNPNRKTYGT